MIINQYVTGIEKKTLAISFVAQHGALNILDYFSKDINSTLSTH